MKNLDLTVFEDVTWSITLPNKEVIEIKKPTQKQLMILEQKVKDVDAEKDTVKRLDKLIKLTQFILENNKGDLKIDKTVLESLTTEKLYAIYFGYAEFANEITINPN